MLRWGSWKPISRSLTSSGRKVQQTRPKGPTKGTRAERLARGVGTEQVSTPDASGKNQVGRGLAIGVGLARFYFLSGVKLGICGKGLNSWEATLKETSHHILCPVFSAGRTSSLR